jgi:hypothetical protein
MRRPWPTGAGAGGGAVAPKTNTDIGVRLKGILKDFLKKGDS